MSEEEAQRSADIMADSAAFIATLAYEDGEGATELPFASPVTSLSRLSPGLGAAHDMVLEAFERTALLEDRCSALEDDLEAAEDAHAHQMGEAQVRIRELEDAVAGLMDVIRQYESVVVAANTRVAEADQRAADAEQWIRTAERSTVEAMEWLYQHVSQVLEERDEV